MSLRRKLLVFLHNQKKKEAEYTELAYLESTGTQWIDTGLEFQPIKAVIRLCFNNEKTTRQVMGFSSYNTTYFGKSANGLFEVGGNITLTNVNPYEWKEVEFTHNGILHPGICSLTVDGKTIRRQADIGSQPQNFWLFNIPNYGTTLVCHCKISSAKFYNPDTNELIADLIPVLDKDLVPCMYDKVGGKYLYNAGTGDFKGYFKDGSQLVSYLESTGVEYVDSGVECTSDLKVKFKGACLTVVNSACCGGIDLTNNPVYFRHHWSPHNVAGTQNIAINYWCQNDALGFASINPPYTIGDIVEVMVDPVNGEATVNGEIINFEALPDGLTTGKNYGVFARIANTGAIQSRPARFWYFKIYKKDKLVRNLLPVLDSSGTPCMYDVVSEKCLPNAGSGTFNYG